jgi:predicted dehydrogenase
MEMAETLRIGFVGCGLHGSYTIWPCLRYAPVEVAYACDLDLEKADLNRMRFGAERATGDLGEVLADDSVQAVFVVGPPAMHYEVGLQVLEAGKHLFTEKPAGESLAHALELEAAVERNRVQYQVGFQKRFALGYVLARDVAAQPEFGGLRMCKVNYSHWRYPPFGWERTDWLDQLVNMSCHPVDLVRFFMGDPVEAYVLKKTADDGRNPCVLTLIYESGAVATVNMSATDPLVQEWVELSGANQLISVRNLVEYKHWTDPTWDFKDLMPPADEEAIRGWHPEFAIPYQQADSKWLQGYAGEVVAFVEALLEGRPVSPSIADGVATMRWAEAIDRAPEGMSRLELAAAVPA